ncbi:hypothetical protein COCVIDRAFT_103200, partial [Bipolaris victoriae FI3]
QCNVHGSNAYTRRIYTPPPAFLQKARQALSRPATPSCLEAWMIQTKGNMNRCVQSNVTWSGGNLRWTKHRVTAEASESSRREVLWRMLNRPKTRTSI